MANQEILELETAELSEEMKAQRLSNERRFSPPRGACPYGCDGSGWLELADYVEPHELEIFWNGEWWTPCECNTRVAWFSGVKHPRRYPDDYNGPRITPPPPPTPEEIHERFEQTRKEVI